MVHLSLEAKLDEVKTLWAPEEASAWQPPSSSSREREQDKGIWPGLRQDLESLRRKLRENLLRQYEESVRVRDLVLREAAEASRTRERGLRGWRRV